MKNINLIQSRKKKDLTQEQLATMLGYKGRQSVANWENGYISPSLDTALKISEILDEDVAFLFGHKVQDSHTRNTKKQVG